MKRVILLLLGLLAVGISLLAQQVITGKVTDASGLSVPGVNVLVKGTMNGTITDMDGNYSISVDNGNSVLVFSFVGMITQERSLEGKTVLNAVLEDEISDLDEVVVIGYGVQKKKLSTGATSQVKGEELEKMNSVSPFGAMQGKTPGVNIVQKSGKPGEGFKVTVRGIGTVGDATPLYIVDGVQTSIENVNPADIESIDVLKDAASAAIYGARGANGVIIVTTKSGKEGKTQISYDAYYGLQNIYKTLEFCDAQQFMALQDVASLNSTGQRVNWDAKGVDRRSTDPGTNWIDEALNKNAVTQSHTFSMSGGDKESNYSTSLGYSNQEGIIGVGNGQSEYERINLRMNSEHQIIDKYVRFGQHLTLMRINRTGVETGGLYNNNLRGLYTTHPLMANKDENGDYIYNHSFNSEVGNPVASMDIKNQNAYEDNTLVGDVYLVIQPIAGLTLKSMFSVDYYSKGGRKYSPNYGTFTASDVVDYDKVTMDASHGTTTTFENIATYVNTFNAHSITAMVGTSQQAYSGEKMTTEKIRTTYDSFDFAYPSNATDIENPNKAEGKSEADTRYLSFFGRMSYDFKEKYMATVTVRHDGSSKFGSERRYGTFPSASVGWVVTNESFLKKTSVLDFLKLRLSWGQNGNDKIDSFRYYSSVLSGFYYPFGSDDSNQAIVTVPGRGANPLLKWETSEQFNFGIDARMINSKLFATVDLYSKSTKDWLVVPKPLDITGTEGAYKNGGDVTNSGVELALSWNDKIGDLHYSIGVNGAYNKNVVNDIPLDGGVIHGDGNVLWQGIDEIYRAEEGYSIGYFWGYETDGIFQSDIQAQNYKSSDGTLIQKDAKAGDLIYVDQNDDGKLNDEDRVEIGNPHPDFTYGFNLSLDYKGFDFSINATGVMGNQIAKGMVDFGRPGSTNYPIEFYNESWSTSNRNGKLPRMLTSTKENWSKFSDIYIEDGDYLRIQNVTLGYDLTKLLKTPFSQARIYVQAQNLLTLTGYSGMDPEIGYAPQDWAAGVDIGYYPHPRTFLAGVNIKF